MPLSVLKTQSVRVFLNAYLDGIGEIKALEIDRDRKEITAQVALDGEPELIELRALHYQLDDSGLVFTHFACARPWVTTALNRFVANRKFAVPPGVVMSALKAVL